MTAIGSKECPKANVLNAMPKSMQPKAKAHLKDIWMAETKASADAAFDFFIEAYGVKYDRAVKCLTKDRAPKFDSKTDKRLISFRPNGQKCYNTSAVRRVLAG